MNLLFWKHKEKGHVIKNDCYDKLPKMTRPSYYQTVESPTHRYHEDEPDYITPIVIGSMLSDDSSYQSNDTTSHGSSFSGFGGGDFGGGGSSDSWGTDSSTNYDSGSSYDSGSYDSSSSSSDY